MDNPNADQRLLDMGVPPPRRSAMPQYEGTVRERVVMVIAEELALTCATVLEAKDFHSLGGDSLDLIEVGMALEDEFGIDTSDQEIGSDMHVTLDRMVEVVEARLAAKA